MKKRRKQNRHTDKLMSQTHLAFFVDVLFEVVLFPQDRLGDEVLVVDTDGGQQRGSGGVRQPGDLGGLLEVLVVQVETSLHGQHLSTGIPGWTV